MNRVLLALVVMLTVALTSTQTTAGPMILVVIAGGAWIGAYRAVRRAQDDRLAAEVARRKAAQIAHDVNRMNVYHHRRSLR